MKRSILKSLWLCAVLCISAGTATAAKLPPELAKAVADYDAAQIEGDGAVMGVCGYLGQAARTLAGDLHPCVQAGQMRHADDSIAIRSFNYR